MPTYAWTCDKCKIEWEVKMKMSEHALIKDHYCCTTCGEKARQLVSPLNFRLAGECWYGRGAGNNSTGLGYQMTDTEMQKNKDQVAKLEDVAGNMSEKFNGSE